jgi:predicted amidohydrolase YtcJ
MLKRLSVQFLLLSSAAVLLTSCGTRVQPADLVLRNGKIVTVDPAKPEAQALAARGDTVVALGTNEEIQQYVGPDTKVIDLAGKLAVPGLTDAHGHFTSTGEAKMSVDVMNVKNWDEIVAKVGEAAKNAQPGEWIHGRGWHQEKWDAKPVPNVEGFPVHDALSKVTPNNPVILTHASGHATIANAKAMELAGITKRTADPPGGKIVKDAKGNPIGVFEDHASGLLRKAMAESLSKRTPEQVQAEERKAVELAIQDCLSKGITSFHDAGASLKTIDLFKKFADEGKLGLRL